MRYEEFTIKYLLVLSEDPIGQHATKDRCKVTQHGECMEDGRGRVVVEP